MSISYKNKYIFVHIQKTGGSSIHSVFDQLGLVEDGPEYLRGKITSEFFRKKFPYTNYWHHLKAKDIKAVIPLNIWNSFFKFAFVRNPWDRALSIYSYRKQQVDNPKSVNYRQNIPDSFEQWLQESAPSPQLEHLADDNGNVLMDFIGRFENLQADFQAICSRINLPPINLPHIRKSAHKRYTDSYSPQARQLVDELYKSDIEHFGYTFEQQTTSSAVSIPESLTQADSQTC